MSDSGTVVLKRNVLREDIKKHLIDRIISGDLKPGDRLVETLIAKELGVSQSPVREAFRDLEQEGMLEIQPYKGSFVRKLSVQDLKNVYAVRAELEGLAIRTAVPQITELEMKELASNYKKMLEAAACHDLQAQIKLDIEFHEIIITAARNSILKKAWHTVKLFQWTYYGTYQYKYDKTELAKRHDLILEAIQHRDVGKAEESMRKHFLELSSLLVED